jgi:hypothetical protein
VVGNQRLPRCRVHPDIVLAVHPKRWGWICRRCRARQPADRAALPVCSASIGPPDRQARLEQQVRPASCPGVVPSLTSSSGDQDQSKRRSLLLRRHPT